MFPLYYSGLGKRKNNEDYFLSFYADNILVLGVADGVGGNDGGEIASRTALESFKRNFLNYYKKMDVKSNISKCIEKAHEDVLSYYENDIESDMATTLTIGVIDENEILIGHVGDSRAYIIRDNGIKQLTEDDTEVNKLVATGLLSKQEAINYPRKNILTNAIGIKDNFEFHIVEFGLKNKDRFLFMTDGFYSCFTKEELRDLSKKNIEFSNFFNEIVNISQAYQPNDNFTVVGVEI